MLFHMEPRHLRRARIATELRAELAKQQKTRASLSQATDISLPVLRRRLAGVMPFYIEELDACCRFLNIPLAVLLDRAESAEAAQ
jgi:hypothetical protein